MSLYKILEEVKPIRRFQLVQRAEDAVEVRILADQPETAFEEAHRDLNAFFQSKGLHVNISLSETPPQADPVSGKFKHIFKDFSK